MHETIIGIRCVNYDEKVRRIYKIIHKIFPTYKILFFSDSLNKNGVGFPKNANVVRITKDALSSLKLSYEDKRTGWKAGDYSYCLALTYDWDYMWLIEPDIFISEDNYELFRNIESRNVDLITSIYDEQGDDWYWSHVIRQVTSFKSVFCAFFPLTRLSRKLAEKVYLERKKISSKLSYDRNLSLPNDESVVGSVAHFNKMSTLVLKDEYSEQFKDFNWNVNYSYDDISSKSGIYHSVDKQQKKLLIRLQDFLKNVFSLK